MNTENPNSANAALAAAYDDHEWKPAVLDTNTTDGIKNTLRAHAAAIQALADHIDGVKKHPDAPVPAYQGDPERKRARVS